MNVLIEIGDTLGKKLIGVEQRRDYLQNTIVQARLGSKQSLPTFAARGEALLQEKISCELRFPLTENYVHTTARSYLGKLWRLKILQNLGNNFSFTS